MMALEMYKSNDPKGIEFKYQHCWKIVKDALEWAMKSQPGPVEHVALSTFVGLGWPSIAHFGASFTIFQQC